MEFSAHLKHFLDEEGRLIAYPSKHKKKICALFFFSEKFTKGNVYSEKEVNEILNSSHTFQDPCLIRREMVNYRFFSRERDGSVYRLENEQPDPKQFGL